ncbi:MAG: T9SS type A sorting domain-containing protein [Bacteroidetes bacterium]|nr:T9SS type A sorting domain-containing protein [Bacteroidota bacterium]
MYCANYNGGVNSGKDSIYRSTDNGDSWVNIRNNLSSSMYGQYLMSHGDTVFYGMQSARMYRSTDAGQSWHVDSVGMDNPRTQSGLIDGNVIYSGGNYYLTSGVGGNGGLYVSTNNGTSWVRKYFDFHNGDINSIVRVGQRMLLSVSGQKEKGVFLSTDRGTSWKRSNTGLTVNGGVPVTLSRLFEHKGRIFAFGASNVPNGVFMTFDSGSTWQLKNSGLYQYATINNFYADADTVYGSMKEGLFRTTDFGTSWQSWGTGLPTSNIGGVIVKNDTMYASSGTKTIYRSLNRGRTWKSVTTNQTAYVPYQFFIYNNRLLTVTGGKLYSCADTGATWTEVNSASFGFNVVSVAVRNNHLIVNVNTKGLYHTSNDGAQWTQINTGLPSATPSLHTFTIASDTLYAAYGNGGFYQRALTDAGITDVKRKNGEVIPSELELSQNFPNPFNPSTRIQFSIPQSGFVTLNVYDAIGREVATVVQQQMNTGSYSAEFNGAGLSSGVYFYQLKAGTFTAMKKMLLIK